jgi:subtilisin family serine protease
MKPFQIALSLGAALSLAACGSSAVTASAAPTPAPVPVVTTPSTVVPPVVMTEPPKNWQLLDESLDHIPGISVERALTELLSGRTPARAVTVAIIDSGVDTSQVDLRSKLWTNPKETPANGVDDDHNGYVDDVHGWDFIGGANGKDVDHDTFEVTREYARCHNLPAASGQSPITDSAYCAKVGADYDKQKSESEGNLQTYRQISAVMKQIIPVLKDAAHTDSLTPDRVRALQTLSTTVARARDVYLQLAGEGATPAAIDEGLESLENQVKYSLNTSWDPRGVVGDHYTDLAERHYGNNDVTGPDAMHGTHVAGIIGAVRDSVHGVGGIAPSVKLMVVRTVPDGDERDKDVANAIRYAVDNGAQIISMSFGKAYSPYKADVDDAVKYADAHGVLMVHAAGNDGADLAMAKNYPNPYYLSGGRAHLWLEIGASSWKGGDSLAASFSNYGKEQVDVFAPGVDILSTVPGNHFERESGTSMAAPTVSGLAALILDYYPNLSAADVRKIIVESASRHTDQMVARPGEGNVQVPFGSLSVSGGIVNAYSALQMAQEMSNGKVHP